MLPIADTTIQALGWTLLHFVWQGAVVAGLLALVRRLSRRAHVRHAISVAALAACVLLPAGTFVLLQPEPLREPALDSPVIETSPTASVGRAVVAPRDMARPTMPMPNLPLGTYRDTPLTVLQRYTPAIVLLWVTGVFAMMMRLVSGCWVTHRLRRVGISPLPEEWLHRVRQLAADLGLRRGVEVVVSSVATVPMVVGALRPVVLVPVATLFGLTPQQLEAILVHELEHVRRYDGVVILVQRLVETLLFYHPAVWWISSCVQREREFCCDDTVAARADARLYAEALTALEGLRTPVTVAASTDGPLLSRVRRLLALDSSSPATPPRVTLPNVIGTLALFAALALGASSSVSSEKAMAQPANGVLLEDVRVPTRSEIAEASMGEVWLGSGGGNGGTFSTIVDAYVAALAAGGDDWSAPHVAATFGYPFHFVLKEGAVQHDHNCNIETSLFFERMNDLGWGTVRFVEATGGGNEPNMERLTARREEAWEAVTASIDRGMPAIAWSPLQDHHFSDWGLLVGYDADTESYHVSHVQTDSVYTIPFDGFGQAWFHVIVFTERTEADPRIADVATLRHAVEFSKGLRYSAEESRSCGVDAIGFDAYRLWIDALASGEFDPAVAREHAWQLMHTRQLAAEYTSQAANRFEGAVRARLQRASDHYVQQSEVCRQLLDIVTPWATQAWTPSEAEEARKLVELALSWERGAVMFLEVALLNLGEEIPGEPTNPGVAMLQSEPRAVVEVAVAPTEPHRGTTLASTLEPVLHTLGRDGWTQARIQGVLGHAFQFQMAEGGVDVWHDNLDWSLGLEVLQQIAQLRTYDAQKEAPAAEREIAQREARDAVRESLKRGVPAIVWNPKTLAKREAGHPGGRGVCWGLIVGYDESQQSYTIRHPFVWQGDYTIGYDEIGDAGATNWLNVMVFDEARKADDDELHRMALRNALSFADGTRQGEHRWTQGFHAYETWLAAFESPDLPGITGHHANMLTSRRELAAEYMRELSGMFEDAAEPLEAAARHYEREHVFLEQLQSLANRGRAGGYSDADRAKLAQLLREALDAERAAVEQIRVALRTLGEEAPAGTTGAATASGGTEALDVRVDVTPPRGGSTLAGTVYALLQAAGHPEWTLPRIHGVLGHTFQWEARPGGAWVYDDNLDWGLGLEALSSIAQFRTFETYKEEAGVDLESLKREARDAVVASLDRGVPAFVWSPISREQKETRHPAHHGVCWGLIVGYDEGDATYTIRHPFVQEAYAVPIDEIGAHDEWVNIKVWDGPIAAEPRQVHAEALRNGLAFVAGERYTGKLDPERRHGLVGYEMWRDAFASPDIPMDASHHHASTLRSRRGYAADYMRQLVEIFPEAADPLRQAAAEYDREMVALNSLFEVMDAAAKGDGLTEEDRAQAQRLVDAALDAERAAVEQIEVALRTLGEEAPPAHAATHADAGMNVAADVTPTRPNDGTTLASTLNALLTHVGQPEWSMARLQGVMGHAFQFQMPADASHQMHDNLDWSIALEAVPQIGQFKSFEASKEDTDIDLWAYKAEARDATLQSLERGQPVLVWQPMSREQQADKSHPAHHAYCWGLVVGYNEDSEEYTVRHPFVPETYTVRYDSIGHSDGHEWFHLKMWQGDSAAPEGEIHREALRHAVEFADGSRFTDENWIRADGRQVRPYGFAAYTTWHDAFDASEVVVPPSVHHTHMLRMRRTAAAAYMRELVDIFPDAAGSLQTAAKHYDSEVEHLQPLFDLVDTVARDRRRLTDDERSNVQRLIRAALEADRAAVGQIEVVLAQLDE